MHVLHLQLREIEVVGIFEALANETDWRRIGVAQQVEIAARIGCRPVEIRNIRDASRRDFEVQQFGDLQTNFREVDAR
jgi:hypothetical protein